MPQGGIDPDETPRDAAWRELREEVGTDRAQLIAESRSLVRLICRANCGRRAGAIGTAGRARSGSRSASPARTRTSTSPRTSRNSCAGAGRGPTRFCAWSSPSSVRSTKRSSTSSALCWRPERRRFAVSRTMTRLPALPARGEKLAVRVSAGAPCPETRRQAGSGRVPQQRARGPPDRPRQAGIDARPPQA